VPQGRDQDKREPRSRGFTLIELLIVVTIIGIIAALAIPNLRNAIDRAKQKATMTNMKGIGNALEMYSVDNNTYPKGLTDANSAALGSYLSPLYMRTLPPGDGWDNPWHIDTSASGTQYTITSYGRDGAPGTNSGGQTTDLSCDIIYTNSSFYQSPGGVQQ
jgi:general secretion pathway protein G